MSLPSRSASLLLLAALLGAAGVAVAAPQQQQHRGRGALPTDEDPPAPRRAAAPRPDWGPSQPPRRSDDALSDSVRRVEQRTRGQVLSAERVPYDGRNLNRIKVVDDRGRVRVYMDDPQQGASPQGQGDDAPTRDNDD